MKICALKSHIFVSNYLLPNNDQRQKVVPNLGTDIHKVDTYGGATPHLAMI